MQWLFWDMRVLKQIDWFITEAHFRPWRLEVLHWKFYVNGLTERRQTSSSWKLEKSRVYVQTEARGLHQYASEAITDDGKGAV